MANSMATVGGTVALLAGVFVGGQVVDASGSVPVIVAAGIMWLVASPLATRITHPARAAPAPGGAGARRGAARLREFSDGIGHLAPHAERAIGPIASITLDQMGQGIVLVLSLVVFRDASSEGVGSFSNLIGAGGVGVLARHPHRGLARGAVLEGAHRRGRLLRGRPGR